MKGKEDCDLKLEDQVASLDLCKKLKDLGMKQESLFWWYQEKQPEHLVREWKLWTPYGQVKNVEDVQDEKTNVVSAFTTAELIYFLPHYFGIYRF